MLFIRPRTARLAPIPAQKRMATARERLRGSRKGVKLAARQMISPYIMVLQAPTRSVIRPAGNWARAWAYNRPLKTQESPSKPTPQRLMNWRLRGGMFRKVKPMPALRSTGYQT